MRLSLSRLHKVPAKVRRPGFVIESLRPRIVHLGLGAFHRAHQAVFTDDANEAARGDWGFVGVSMRKPDVASRLGPQDCLYTVETLADPSSYRIIGSVRDALTLPLQPERVVAAIASRDCDIVTLTVTEKGYCLNGNALDTEHPDIRNDLAGKNPARSAVGVLYAGLAARSQLADPAPISVISCDNLAENGRRLGAATLDFARLRDPAVADWIAAYTTFPETMVDSIVPASDSRSEARVNEQLGLIDAAPVQREPFAQWVIEDEFAGPRPAWDAVGVDIVKSVKSYRQLKLHILNAAHSALAYLGLPRGYTYVREAIMDPEIRRLLDAMVQEEIAPALTGLEVLPYWQKTLHRFDNPRIDHRLDQIAQDGAQKLAQRIYPILAANIRCGRPASRLALVTRAWIQYSSGQDTPSVERRLEDDREFPPEFREDKRIRAAIVGEHLR